MRHQINLVRMLESVISHATSITLVNVCDFCSRIGIPYYIYTDYSQCDLAQLGQSHNDRTVQYRQISFRYSV